MNKSDFVAALAEQTEMSKAQAGKVYDTFVELLTQSVSSGEALSIPGFGTFKIADRAAREGRNPATGETIQIEASKVVKFAAASALKQVING
mgnify:CR=1 FL=1